MKEILFRAAVKGKDSEVVGSYLAPTKTRKEPKIAPVGIGMMMLVEAESVCRYLGVKDSDGCRIFERDVLTDSLCGFNAAYDFYILKNDDDLKAPHLEAYKDLKVVAEIPCSEVDFSKFQTFGYAGKYKNLYDLQIEIAGLSLFETEKKYIKTLDGYGVVGEIIEDNYYLVREHVGDGTIDDIVMSNTEIEECEEVTKEQFEEYIKSLN